MSSEEDITARIDRYLDNELTTGERAEFEQQVRLNARLRLEVDAQRAVRKTVQERGDEELKATFEQFYARMQAESTPRSLWSRVSTLAIAASLTLFMVAAGIVWSNRDSIFGAGQSAVLDGNTFRIPVIETGENALGYGGVSTSDSVMVQVLSDKQYANHYRFKDTLQIFSPAFAGDRTRWKLEYNPELNMYILVAGERRYRLERGFDRIAELKAQ